MSNKVDITIVGAGVIGCAVARELSHSGRETFVLEKNSGITRGENQSSRNSGVIHAGLFYDRATRPLKARLCV
ncbi:MAG: FAD-dependent oxidoreductase, partial [Desulfobacterales bacterium]